MTSMRYELRQYDDILLKFSTKNTEYEELIIDIDYVNPDRTFLLPIGMEISSKGLEQWLSHRVIPQNREFSDEILASCGLSPNDTMGIINICKGLSLNDSYWVVEEDFKGTFSQYNLYQNKFTRTLALIAYTGYGSMTKKGFTSSPEFTTNGMLKKCWRRIDGHIYLYKGGTSGACNTGNEPYAEYYASQIADTLGFKHISYELVKWKNTLCSTCELFTNIDTSYVPIYKFRSFDKFSDIVDFTASLGSSIYNDFCDMMIFDALIYNIDRHLGNFGLLVDNHTNKPIGLAPIFDNGLSLFNFELDSDMPQLKEKAKLTAPAFKVKSFDIIAKTLITERQKSALRKMINFKFKKHPKYNWTDYRLKSLEDFLEYRVQELLKL